MKTCKECLECENRMSLYDEITRSQFILILSKILPQRPEHIATVISWFPKMYPYKHVTIEKFEKIPRTFFPIYHAVLFKGGKLEDGSVYGTYSLTLHGRGKRYGQNRPSKARYLAGCKFIYDISKPKPIRIVDLKCNIRVFLNMLHTVKDVNAVILRKKGVNVGRKT